jgi:hypothetical protein
MAIAAPVKMFVSSAALLTMPTAAAMEGGHC